MDSKDKRIFVAVANGTEDVEVIAHIDIFRRASSDKKSVVVVKIDGKNKDDLICTLSNGTKIVADTHLLSVSEKEKFDLIFIPGGYKGSEAMRDCEKLIKMMNDHNSKQGLIASVCAAPVLVLTTHGFLNNFKSATCYPALQDKLPVSVSNEEKKKRVCHEKNIVTSQGLGSSIESALYCIEVLYGKEKAENLKKATVSKF